jgi:LAO/AO transport system kinase
MENLADPAAVAEGVREGAPRAVARAITWIEDHDPRGEDLVRRIYPQTGGADLVGITGPPGVGKSTIVTALVRRARAEGRKVGVVSVDPSSPFTQGALLGDRIRLVEHFLDRDVFIRSMGTRGHLGGMAEASLQAALVMDAAGCDLIFMETVGVGQSEVEVIGIADTVVLALLPGSGDAIQALKAGIMEIPDVIVINKADHPMASLMAAEVRTVLSYTPNREWMPPIVRTEAVRDQGIDKLVDGIRAHQAWLDEDGGRRRRARRRRSIENEIVTVAAARLRERLARVVATDVPLATRLDDVDARRVDPLTVVGELMARVGRERA